MGRVFDLIKKILFKGRIPDEAEAEELRNEFRGRYHHFKLLLNANNRALEIMAEIEELLRGSRPFGMTHVRARCAQASIRKFGRLDALHLDLGCNSTTFEIGVGQFDQGLYLGFAGPGHGIALRRHCALDR